MNTAQTELPALRALDHLVLPVPSLAITRARLTALGFQVSPDARHPFGTENACVFFEDGTYLEPLAVGDAEKAQRAAQRGNVFTARDAAYRFRNGDSGFSALVLATDHADADHKRFKRAGVSAGKKLLFGRTMTDPKGNKGKATFKLAFAADLRSPDSFFFNCERVSMPPVDRSALTVHPNGVTGLAHIIASEADPAAFGDFLDHMFGHEAVTENGGNLQVRMSTATLHVLTPKTLLERFGVARRVLSPGIKFEGMIMTCMKPTALQTLLDKSGIEARQFGRYLIVPPAPGQGATIAFDRESDQ